MLAAASRLPTAEEKNATLAVIGTLNPSAGDVSVFLPTEQALSMSFLTADALDRAEAGSQDAAALLRILTPTLKFRATRDARKVCGDALEMRGGIGYIEEFATARLLRDAHLGSIWEGTGNIVAIDALKRAVGRHGADALGRQTSRYRLHFRHRIGRACACDRGRPWRRSARWPRRRPRPRWPGARAWPGATAWPWPPRAPAPHAGGCACDAQRR